MKKHKIIRRKMYNLLLCLFLIILAACGGILAFSKTYSYSFHIIDENNMRPMSSTIRELSLTITSSTTMDDVASKLYAEGFIGNKFWFKLESKLYSYNDCLIPGTYHIASTMTNVEMLKLFTTIPKAEDEVQFTIPEGFSVLQIANRLDDKNIVSKEDFLDAINNKTFDYPFLRDLPENTQYRLEGYLFPDTYTIHKGASSEEIIMMMLNRFAEISSRYTQYLYSSNYTLHDILTIASIIEREAKLDEERATISGVIYNRLNNEMPLQMCSTVQYAMEKRKVTLTSEDLTVDSPYNTYLYSGLPVGPICCPGENALEAAFIPEENDFFYFVLKNSSEGSHAFSSTAEEHASYKAQYKQSQDVNFID